MATTDKQVKGEGDHEAARHYNESTQDFVDSGQVQEQEETTRDVSEQERERLTTAEKAGEEKAKEHDPSINRDYSEPA
ncbi:MAG: hypothetical protein V2J55_02920 [Candidatus Competibacteraceae bacterium]|jgi:hypothetical protein|nr:hypothetical protein [Candidatus Competibacteraceae bacterium]